MTPGSVRELLLGPGLSLVDDPGVHRGKTGGMDKGLFLRVQGRLCAGESAGIGLPVLRAGRRTVFPACRETRFVDDRTMVKTFHMEKTLRWRLGTVKAPLLLADALGLLADGYMRFPAFQQALLGIRGTLFALLRMSSFLETGEHHGTCTVICRACPGELLLRVDGSRLEGRGRLILLNELQGELFSRLRLGRVVREGREIPAWRKTSFAHSLESPLLGLGVALAPGPDCTPEDYRLFCGRELGRMLDWAGMALTCRNPVFSYRVRFFQTGLPGGQADGPVKENGGAGAKAWFRSGSPSGGA